MRSEVVERLERIMRLVLEDGSLLATDTMTAREVEGWDSLANIEMLVAIEREFGVELPLVVAVDFENVGQLVDWLDERT